MTSVIGLILITTGIISLFHQVPWIGSFFIILLGIGLLFTPDKIITNIPKLLNKGKTTE